VFAVLVAGRSAPSSTLAFNEQSGNCSGPEIGFYKDVVSDQESPCLVGFARGLLLNNRLQTEGLHCNWELRNANKTNENRSVQTGQGELANRRHHVCI